MMTVRILILMLFSMAAVPVSAMRPDQLTFPPLELVFPEVVQHRTENGMNLYLKKDDELPLVEVTVMIEGGSIYDPSDKTGLSEWFVRALETAGTAGLTPGQFEDELDRMAAQLAVSSSSYHYQIDLSLHRRDLQRGLEILADLLLRPRFDEQRIELARQQLIEGIHRRNDNPGAIARRYLAQAITPGHPFGLEPVLADVTAFTQDDLWSLHRQFFYPQRFWWGISGDFDEADLIVQLERLLGPSAEELPALPSMPQLPDPAAPQVYLVDKKFPQTNLILGRSGISKDHPDIHPVRLANYLFGGGGFNSRLMQEVRSNRGLAYSIYSSFQPGRRLPELFFVSGETGNETAVDVIRLVMEMLADFGEQPVSADELASAKSSLINSFIFAFENTHSVVTQKLRLDFYDYPKDYLETYREQLDTLTAADIQRAATTYFTPKDLQIVLVGDADILLPELEQHGFQVEIIDLNRTH